VAGLTWNRGSIPPAPPPPRLSGKSPAPAERKVVSARPGQNERIVAAKKERAAKPQVQDAAIAQQNRAAAMNAQQAARERIKPLIEDALQLDDEGKRLAAIGEFRKAIASNDPEEVLAGLSGLSAVYTLAFDRAPFREVLKPHLQSDNDTIRTSAWSGMLQCEPDAQDLALLREVARTQGCGESTAYLLFVAEKGDLTGESGEIVRDLVCSEDPQVKRRAMNGIWGAKLSPELEEELIVLSYKQEYEHDTIYYALSTQANKSADTVDRLVEILAHPDSHNMGGRAAWGLQQGVSKELAPRVADAALKIVGTRASGYMWEQGWNLMKQYSGPGNLEALRELAAKPGIQGEKREQLNALIGRIETQPQ